MRLRIRKYRRNGVDKAVHGYYLQLCSLFLFVHTLGKYCSKHLSTWCEIKQSLHKEIYLMRTRQMPNLQTFNYTDDVRICRATYAYFSNRSVPLLTFESRWFSVYDYVHMANSVKVLSSFLSANVYSFCKKKASMATD